MRTISPVNQNDHPSHIYTADTKVQVLRLRYSHPTYKAFSGLGRSRREFGPKLSCCLAACVLGLYPCYAKQTARKEKIQNLLVARNDSALFFFLSKMSGSIDIRQHRLMHKTKAR
jgi:hypothetical protein